MATDPLLRARAICLALPESSEVLAWNAPTFRVRKKIFAMYAAPNNHHGGGRPALWCKADDGDQEFFLESDPSRYFAPPYLGPSGWVGIWLDKRPRWSAVTELVHDSYRLIAPKRVVAAWDAR